MSSGAAGRRLRFAFNQDAPAPDCGARIAGDNPTLTLEEILGKKNKECAPRRVVQFVLGGKAAAQGRFPYIVSLRKPSNGEHYCGGSLIAPNKVLTAAHCIRRGELPKVRIGALRRNSLAGATEVGAARTEVHPRWSGNVAFGHDIAIITLERSVGFKPVKVAGPETVLREGQALQVAGWGLNGPESVLPDPLQVGTVNVVPQDECNRMYKEAIDFEFVTETMICAFSRLTDACSGDSGGPLIIPDPSGNPGGDILVGDVSLGVGGCVIDGTPAIYGDIMEMHDFVKPHLPTPAAPSFSGVSPRPSSGCHEEHQVAWRIAVCPYGQELWKTFLQPRLMDVLEEEAALTPASVRVATDWGFGGTSECSCSLYTRVTVSMTTFDAAEAKGLEDFVQVPANIINPTKDRAFFMQCAETLEVSTRSVGRKCFP